MTRLLLAAAFLIPSAAFAVGSNDTSPPKPTETTMECSDGQVWDADAKECVNPQSGSLLDDELYKAAREFAYAGQFDNTLKVLAAMSDPMDDRVLTYKGFVNRKLGHTELGNEFYLQALAVNPDNILARSYMGQGMVEAGDLIAAREQLIEIRLRGGQGTWAEAALQTAIESGKTYSY